MGTRTPNLNLYKPAVDESGWGEAVNENFDIIDNITVPALNAAKAYTDAETARAESVEATLAPTNSPALTGTPTAPTPADLDNSNKIATTAFVTRAVTEGGLVTSVAGRTGAVTLSESDIAGLVGDLASKATVVALNAEIARALAAEVLLAPLASPAFTGSPTAPTQTALDNTTKISTTAYTDAAVGVEKTRALAAESLLAPTASPTFTGVPSSVTPAGSDNSTKIATTAYVKGQNYITSAGAPVQSVFGRIGVVVASSGDYTAAQVTNAQDNSVSQTQNFVHAAPSGASGAPTWRLLVASDIPALAESGVTGLVSDLALKAPLASPALTGTPTAPTASALDNTTKIATTAYTDAAVLVERTRALSAESLSELLSHKDAVSGYAGLDGSGLLKSSEFPSPTSTTFGGVKSLAFSSTKFLTSIGTDGIPTAAQPAFTDISGTAATGQIPNLPASKIASGQIALAQGGTGADLSGTGGAHQVLLQTSLGATITVAQLAFTDISGTLGLSKGGTNADLSSSGSATAILAQDASHIISARSLVAGDIPNLNASIITAGTVALARGGTNADLSGSGGTTAILAQDASHVITARNLVAADIPSLAASIITSGTLALARGGTNSDLSGTGGSHQVLKQTSLGGNITVAQLAAADLSDTATSGNVLRGNGTSFVSAQLGFVDLSGSVAAGQMPALTGDVTTSAGTVATTVAKIQGVTVSGTTGTVNAVFSNSPTLVTPVLGVATGTSLALGDGSASAPTNYSADSTVGLYRVSAGIEGHSGAINTSGSINIAQLATPSAPVVTPTGGSATTWAYKISALDGTGESLASSAGQTTTGAATLDATHFNTITWTQVNGAATYRVYRTTVGTSPTTTGVIGTVNANATLSLVDNGLAGNGAAVIANNSTGQLKLSGGNIVIGSTSVSNGMQISLGSFIQLSTAAPVIKLSADMAMIWSNTAGNNAASADLEILRNAACILEINNGTSAKFAGLKSGEHTITGSVTVTPLATPSTPVITNGGVAGSTSYSYVVVAKTASGNTPASAVGTTATGNATLTGSNFNTITWTAVPGAITYDIYRTASSGTPSSTGLIASVSGAVLTKNDTGLAGNSTTAPTTNSTGLVQSLGANGEVWEKGQSSELLTLSTSGTTTDTTANLLPANSIIEAVVARVTTTITTATDWKLGDSNQAARFTNANSTLASGTTTVGLNHADPTVASSNLGPVQSAAAPVRVTTTGTPGAGVIRITVFYRRFVAPTG